jgi:hypothetical protein
MNPTYNTPFCLQNRPVPKLYPLLAGFLRSDLLKFTSAGYSDAFEGTADPFTHALYRIVINLLPGA